MSRFRLASSDVHSNTWAKLERHIKERIEELHQRNEGPHDPIETAHNRGRIAELRQLLLTAQEPPPPIELVDGM